MKSTLIAAALVAAAFGAQAQNIAIVNGKPVPKARLDTIMGQVVKSGQPRTPEVEKQVRDEVVHREILMQEAERRGIPASADYKAQIELARQAIMIRELQAAFAKTNAVSDADAQAEYSKVKAAQAGTEYRARHILVETEAEAIALIAQLNTGAKFEDLAAKSKDPGSAARGGDLDWSNPQAYVPEFSKALVALKKGELTQTPVKSQFGFHVIRLDDTREAQFPAFDDVKQQVVERLKQVRWAEYQKKLRDAAKTDYKFGS
jgi:peptidyl-prolyl cis-trans isomerase C